MSDLETSCLSKEKLSELLYQCYQKFNSLPHSIQNIRDIASHNGRGSLVEKASSLAMAAFIGSVLGGVLTLCLEAL